MESFPTFLLFPKLCQASNKFGMTITIKSCRLSTSMVASFFPFLSKQEAETLRQAKQLFVLFDSEQELKNNFKRIHVIARNAMVEVHNNKGESTQDILPGWNIQ